MTTPTQSPALPRHVGMALVVLLLAVLIGIAVLPLGDTRSAPTAQPPPAGNPPPAGTPPADQAATAVPAGYPAPPVEVPATVEAYPGPAETAAATQAPATAQPTPAPTTVAPTQSPRLTPAGTAAATSTPPPPPPPESVPAPTALAFAPSGARALWAENNPYPNGATVWSADPADIAARQKVLAFEREFVMEGVLSPDGARLALITVMESTVTVWVANVDGSDLRQAAQGAALDPWAQGGPSGLFWSPDGKAFVYSNMHRVQVTPAAPGQPDVKIIQTIDRVEIATQAGEPIVEMPDDEPLTLLGLSADGQQVYYAWGWLDPATNRGAPCELWTAGMDGGDARKLVTLGTDEGWPLLSADGADFLVTAGDGLARIPTGAVERRPVKVPEGFELAWWPQAPEWLLARPKADGQGTYAGRIDPQTKLFDVLGELSGAGVWAPVRVSPDRQWLAAYRTEPGARRWLYWVHLPTGAQVPVRPADWVTFVDWLK